MENIKAGREGYKAYDQEEVDELTGQLKSPTGYSSYTTVLRGGRATRPTTRRRGMS